ncbi:unnamed protein product [Coffea canephora]|uniref:Uncharacterized protein n=1 Tax=Coffea canephora TaxID=49390 RepID=A0A068U2S5_COFCA|nr:unnamed protein product [Coffea canephora]
MSSATSQSSLLPSTLNIKLYAVKFFFNFPFSLIHSKKLKALLSLLLCSSCFKIPLQRFKLKSHSKLLISKSNASLLSDKRRSIISFLSVFIAFSPLFALLTPFHKFDLKFESFFTLFTPINLFQTLNPPFLKFPSKFPLLESTLSESTSSFDSKTESTTKFESQVSKSSVSN